MFARTKGMLAALMLSVAACGYPVASLDQMDNTVAFHYGGDYAAYAADNWDYMRDLVFNEDIAAIQHIYANGADLDPADKRGDQNLLRYATYIAPPIVPQMMQLNLDPRPGRVLYGAVKGDAWNGPLDDGLKASIAQYALQRGDYFFTCDEALPCHPSLWGPRGALIASQERHGNNAMITRVISQFLADPQNAQRVAQWEQQNPKFETLMALGLEGPAYYGTGQAAPSQQRTASASSSSSSGGGGGGGGGALMGLFGSVMGSAVGDVIGGSDGALFEQAFSGVMNNALTADSGAEVMTGTMTALGQSSGLMDSGTASMLGMAGSLFGGGGSSAPQSTSTGAIQRPQATQQQVAVPQQSAPLGQPSNYTFSCPMGSGPHTVPVPASNNPQCITAMRTFAYTATCNLVDEMGPAQDAYYSQCAAEIYN